MKIVLATHNPDKFKEMFAILNNFAIDLLSLDNFPKIGEIIEDGSSIKKPLKPMIILLEI